MHIEVRDAIFDPWQEIARYQEGVSERCGGEFGACATFTGTMRNMNEGDGITAMELEHYPGMTEKELGKICHEVAKRWSLLDTLLIHRVGQIAPDEPIVLVAVWSSHRKEAFEACRHIMETLKSSAPFWKKEQLESGATRWVDKNSEGY